MTRRMLKSRKAISPILATLLLIVIAVAAIVVTYAWIMTYMAGAGQQAGVMLYKSNVRFYSQSGTNNKIDIDIGNSGTSDTQIIQVYAGSAGDLQNQTATPTLPMPLLSKSIQKITITFDWTNGATYYFKIVSSSGQALEWPEQAPTS